MERFLDVYNNPSYSDNTVIIRILNTFLPYTEDHDVILSNIIHFKSLFETALGSSNLNRPDIKFIVDKTNYMISNNTFENYVTMLEDVYTQDMMQYKYLWLMCLLRAMFEKYYGAKISFKNPK